MATTSNGLTITNLQPKGDMPNYHMIPSSQSDRARSNIGRSAANKMAGGIQQQSIIVVHVKPDKKEMYYRTVSNDHNRYPGANDTLNLAVYENDLVIGRRKTAPADTFINSVSGFSSLNGLSYEGYGSPDELEDDFWVIGVSRSDYYTISDIPHGRDSAQPEFSAVTFGSASLWDVWIRDIYPGDKLMFSFPNWKEDYDFRNKGGQYSSTKMRPRVVPYNPAYGNYYMKSAIKLAKEKYGTSDGRKSSYLARTGPGGKRTGPQNQYRNKTEAAASGLTTAVLLQALKIIEVLQHRGIIDIVTTADLNNRVGQGQGQPTAEATVNLLSQHATHVAIPDERFTSKFERWSSVDDGHDQYHARGDVDIQTAYASKVGKLNFRRLGTHDARTLWLAEKMGLISSDPAIYGQHSSPEVISNCLNACFPQSDVDFMHVTGKTLMGTAFMGGMKTALCSQLHKVTTSHALDLQEVMNNFKNSLDMKCFGTALSAVREGGPNITSLDIVKH